MTRKPSALFWPSAEVAWTTEGYQLSMWIDIDPKRIRLCHQIEQDLPTKLEDLLGPATVKIDYLQDTSRDQLVLFVFSAKLLATDPLELRDALESALEGIDDDRAMTINAEKAHARQWLDVLRAGASNAPEEAVD